MAKTVFHGILATGRTRADAVNNYRLLALGKGATGHISEDGSIAFIASASDAQNRFNPATGDMDLEDNPGLLESVEFAAHSSDQVEVNHYICKNSCGTHILADSDTLVSFCPRCTAELSLSEDDEEVDSGDGSESEGEDEDDGDEDEHSDTQPEPEDGSEEDEDAASEDETSESSDEEFSYTVVAADFQTAVRQFTAGLLENGVSVSGDKPYTTHYVVCSSDSCGMHIISEAHPTQCPVCLSAVVEPDPDEIPSNLSLDSESEDLGDAGGLPSGDEDEGEDEDDAGATEGEGGEGEDDGADPEPEDDQESESSNSLNVMDDEDEDKGDGEGEVDGDDTEAGEDEDKGDGEADAKPTNKDLKVLSSGTTSLSADLLTGDDADKLDLSYSSNVAGKAAWVAFYEGRPVALAREEDAGKNADVFNTATFGNAVIATAKVGGVKPALAELGFKYVDFPVSVSAEVDKLVAQKVGEREASLSAEQENFKQQFLACLATAAVGLNRGFFAELRNPLKEAMWNALSSAGIHNPEVLIDRAFGAHADDYHRVLFAQASELASKPEEVRNEMAKAVMGTSYQSVSSSADRSNLEARLAGLGVSVSSDTQEPAQASDKKQPSQAPAADDFRSRSQAVLSTLGRRP